MVMDQSYAGFADFINGYKSDDEILFPNSEQYFHSTVNGFQIYDPSISFTSLENSLVTSVSNPSALDPSISLSSEDDSLVISSSASAEISSVSPSWSPDGDSPSSEDIDPVFKFISQMLMEENMEAKPCMFHDPLALQATENSLYDVLGGNNLPSPNQPPFDVNQYFQHPDDLFPRNSCDYDSVDVRWVGDLGESNPSLLQTPFPATNISYSDSVTLTTEILAQNIFSDSDSALQFRRGLEEASKFLPNSNQLTFDLENNIFAPEKSKAPEPVKAEGNQRENSSNGERENSTNWERENSSNGERENSPNGSRGRKNHMRDDTDLDEGRSSKQSAVYEEENELSEMFDKVLLCTDAKGKLSPCVFNEPLENIEGKAPPQTIGQPPKPSGRKTRAKKQGKKETVDLRTLLILCAQAVASADRRTANELLKQIRQHSSQFGDGSQRLAHCFANGLEARLDGSGAGIQMFYPPAASKGLSAATMLKCYQTYLQACPFKKLSYFFANRMISNVAEKAATLHIVDFGISYGFQWPILIQHLAARTGGPPKLRITGIDNPQSGFRPAERLDETGRRLAKYCDRFGVPFEYNCIAEQNWETIQIKDLKIDDSEALVVNCMFRFKNLLDETVEEDCPRDAVLNLIRKMNPAIFFHAITNGSYNAPFFVTRFREALFHFSSLFDLLEANLSPGEHEQRLLFEKEFIGREAMNVIACEGIERVERPETYKQWQNRTLRAGFRQVPLEEDLMKKFRAKMKGHYHKDFVLDEDINWMLQGWKGRITYAASCWVPA